MALTTRSWFFLSGTAACLMAACVYEFSGPPRDPGTATDGREGMMLGVARGPQPELFLVGDSREALDEYARALVSGDRYGKTAMIADGRVFPVRSGTKVLVLEHGFLVRGVRILDGKHAGRMAWVESEFVIPAR